MTTPAKPNRITLERYVAGELRGEELAQLERTLAESPEARGALDALRADEAQFRAEVPYAAFRVEHERRMEARRPTRRWALWAPALAVLAGAAGMLFVGLEPPDDGTRAKGAQTALRATVQDGAVTRAVVSGEQVMLGARVQLAYDAGSFTHVALLGIDVAGAVSVYFSDEGERLALLPAGASGTFPFSLALDDVAGEEQFIAVFATRALPLRALVDAAQGLAAIPARARSGLQLPSGAEQATVWISKK